MASQVIYARVPEVLKDAVDDYATQTGVSLTAAVVDLLGRGHDAASAPVSRDEYEAKVGQLETEVTRLAAELRAATGELATLRALADRTRKPVGTCPTCRCEVRGYDLLATGQCPHCTAALPDMLSLTTSGAKSARTVAGTFNERDLLLLLGAVGAVVGVAYLATKTP